MFGVVAQRYSNNRHEVTQTVFGGYDHRAAASDGAIWDRINMCADRYPALTARKRRGWGPTVAKPNGLYVADCLVWVDGTQLVIDGEAVTTLTDGEKTIAGIGKKICIWPDKVIADRDTKTMEQMEAVWEGQADFFDGTLAGEEALANTITVSGDLTGLFRAGDGVVVTAGVGGIEGDPMGAYVIQEIEYLEAGAKTEIRFLGETWRDFVREDGSVSVGTRIGIRIQRRTPDMEIVFEHHNRLWGISGNEIKCCKLGDPTNWECFDGISTDSWAVELGKPGEVTGGCEFNARPMFFKEHRIITVYGDTPQSFSLSQVEGLGVEAGSGGSLAAAGQTLYYKSPAGVMAYSGGYPRSVAAAFGEEKYRNAVAGSDGVKYYISMEDSAGERRLFVYDTRHGVWHREDGRFVAFGRGEELWGLVDPDGETSPGMLQVLGDPRTETPDEEGIATRVEFADFYDSTTRKKGLGKVILRLEVDAKTKLTISVQYDSDGKFVPVRTVKGAMVKGQIDVPLVIRRCDHYRIRIDGTGLGGGEWTLYALTRDRFVGSNRK